MYTVSQEIYQLVGPGGLLGALATYKLDAVLFPSSWIYAGVSGALGAPVISVPLGAFEADTPITPNTFDPEVLELTPNYPFGISFSGPRFSEELLIGIAYAFEQKTLVRQKVKPLPNPEDGIGRRHGQDFIISTRCLFLGISSFVIPQSNLSFLPTPVSVSFRQNSIVQLTLECNLRPQR